MKIYTEEQVKDAFIKGILKGMAGSTLSTYELFEMYISEVTPIELPSDEDIEEQSLEIPFRSSRIGFKKGAKWIKEQILKHM